MPPGVSADAILSEYSVARQSASCNNLRPSYPWGPGAPLALIVTASHTENDMSDGSGAEARL